MVHFEIGADPIAARVSRVDNKDVLIMGLPTRADETLIVDEDEVNDIIQRWVSLQVSITVTQLSNRA